MAADGNGLVGGIGQYEDIWWMAYVRGPKDHRVDSRANRPTPPSTARPVCSCGCLPRRPPDCRFSLGRRPECRTLTGIVPDRGIHPASV